MFALKGLEGLNLSCFRRCVHFWNYLTVGWNKLLWPCHDVLLIMLYIIIYFIFDDHVLYKGVIEVWVV